MLRKLRISVAVIFFALITLLFLDFTGTIHAWFGWMAKIQFLPAVLALNVGVVLLLLILTLTLGRVYCSVICPLGIFQDLVSRISGSRKKKKYRLTYSPALTGLRYGVLALFIVALVAGIGSLVALLAPYSSYGRIVSSLFVPIYQWGNNLLAYGAERVNSYAFYRTEVWVKSVPVLGITMLTFIVISILSWRNGRTYCNTICPVGTVLCLLSRYSLLRPVIDTTKCNQCSLCSRQCKSACIDSKTHQIDYSRCVVCMDCIDTCKQGAIRYSRRSKVQDAVIGRNGESGKGNVPEQIDEARRKFLSISALLATSTLLKAQEKKVDGGLAAIADKQVPVRATRLVPPGALGIRNFAQHCTACQLCVSVCPNQVLRPSAGLVQLMQPEMSYERGYCRPECTQCSEVCPAGAIRPVTPADKSAIQVGHAVWLRKNCIPLKDGVDCDNCARHCPVQAIEMIPSDPSDEYSSRIPAIDTERCIGCGACENLCPARPFSAIYVEGHERHRLV